MDREETDSFCGTQESFVEQKNNLNSCFSSLNEESVLFSVPSVPETWVM